MTRRSDTGTADRKQGRAEPLITGPTRHAQSPLEQGVEDTSSIGPSALQGRVASFGSFRLHVDQRLLEKNSTPLKIGSRALDILITLLERSPEIVGKRELVRRAWGDLVVDEGSLRVHVTALRKQLGDGNLSASYVSNIHGRGYCFVGAVTWTAAEASPRQTPRATAPQLPPEPLLMVGRDDAVRELTARLQKHRFVSIVGPGGIGKTTIALALAHRTFGEFHRAVHFLDLAALEDPRLLASMLASQLGLVAVSDQPLPGILTFLREKQLLLVFDSCEHVIEAVAPLTENIFRDAPQVHILVTSREALRAEGEQVHHLPPLECPPPYVQSLTATQALNFPAVQLFVKHIADGDHSFALTDSDAPSVAEICRRLDGIPLALGLAASRVGVYGVQGTASLLDKHFRLLWHGRRTALPRHQTLGAALDWSYKLLSDTEQLVLRRLAIFVAGFSLAAALDVASEGLDAAEVTETLATLVDKSLVTVDGATAMRYRLLETTRAYALAKLVISGEQKTIAQRHAEYISSALERFEAKAWKPLRSEGIDFFVSQLSNVRAALDWSFAADGDGGIAVRLAAAAVLFFFQLSLLPECVAWSGRALRRLAPISATPLALQLQTCLGMALMYIDNSPAGEAALVEALQLAQSLEDAVSQLLLILAIYRYNLRRGEWRELRELTSHCEAVAAQVKDPLANVIARATSAATCHHLGEHVEALQHARIACNCVAHSSQLNADAFSRASGVFALMTQARSLWMLGYPDQAVETSRKAIKEAEDLNHPPTTAYALAWNALVFLYTGDWQTAEEWIRRITVDATRYGLTPCHSIAIGYQGVQAVRLGELLRGTELLQTAVARLRTDGYEGYRRVLSGELAEGLLKAGATALAHTIVCEAVEQEEACGPSCHMPELLRVKGAVLSSMAHSDSGEAEECLLSSLRLARDHRALSLELRTGMSLARLWAASGRSDNAMDLLTSIYSRFSEGFQTLDLVSAARLLDELRSRTTSDG